MLKQQRMFSASNQHLPDSASTARAEQDQLLLFHLDSRERLSRTSRVLSCLHHHSFAHLLCPRLREQHGGADTGFCQNIAPGQVKCISITLWPSLPCAVKHCPSHDCSAASVWLRRTLFGRAAFTLLLQTITFFSKCSKTLQFSFISSGNSPSLLDWVRVSDSRNRSFLKLVYKRLFQFPLRKSRKLWKNTTESWETGTPSSGKIGLTTASLGWHLPDVLSETPKVTGFTHFCV